MSAPLASLFRTHQPKPDRASAKEQARQVEERKEHQRIAAQRADIARLQIEHSKMRLLWEGISKIKVKKED